MNTTRWTFPTLAHVWEYRTGAIMAGAGQLDGLTGTDREHCRAELTERVQMLVSQLDDGSLVATSFFMVDDIFKSYARLQSWTPGIPEYIAATATVVVQELDRRGLALHYVVDATEGNANLSAMLTYLPVMFTAAGLAVVGPQLVAIQLQISAEGQPPADIAEIQRYRDEGHTMADELIARLHQKRRSSAYLNLDFADDLPGLSMEVALSQRGTPGNIVVFRNTPPIEGSQAYFFPPPGVSLPPGIQGSA